MIPRGLYEILAPGDGLLITPPACCGSIMRSWTFFIWVASRSFAMGVFYVLGGLVAVVLFVYLFAALLKPEWF